MPVQLVELEILPQPLRVASEICNGRVQFPCEFIEASGMRRKNETVHARGRFD
jgi:hypothetical protein